MLEAEKHRNSHRQHGKLVLHHCYFDELTLSLAFRPLAKILSWTLKTLVILQIINGAIISAISATSWGTGVSNFILTY